MVLDFPAECFKNPVGFRRDRPDGIDLPQKGPELRFSRLPVSGGSCRFRIRLIECPGTSIRSWHRASNMHSPSLTMEGGTVAA